MTQTIDHQSILGVILAGGQGQRMQGQQPKWQLPLGKQSIIEHIIARFQPQVGQLAINGRHPELKQYPYPLIQDLTEGFQGPLAGLLAGLDYARNHNIPWVATCPCDAPFVPLDYVEQLIVSISPTTNAGAIIQSQGRSHPVFGLWSTELYEPLKMTLETSEHRGIGYWACKLRDDIAQLDYINTTTPIEPDPFANINTLEEWREAQQYSAAVQATE